MTATAALRPLLICALLLTAAGCTDLYYQALGRGAWPHEDPDLLYNRLGGRDGIDAAVARFADTASTDPQLRPQFAKSDMARFRNKLAEQICTVSGGPCVYTGLGMTDAHAGLTVTEADRDAFLNDLDAAFAARNVDADARRMLRQRLGDSWPATTGGE